MDPDALDAHIAAEVATWGPIPQESRDRIANVMTGDAAPKKAAA